MVRGGGLCVAESRELLSHVMFPQKLTPYQFHKIKKYCGKKIWISWSGHSRDCCSRLQSGHITVFSTQLRPFPRFTLCAPFSVLTRHLHDPASRDNSFPCHVFHDFTKITQTLFCRNKTHLWWMGLQASKNLGNMPHCHTLLRRSKNASDTWSPAWSDLTFFVILVLIYPNWKPYRNIYCRPKTL